MAATMNDKNPSRYQQPLTTALFGNGIILKNFIGKLILANEDVFKTMSNDFSVEENDSFKVVNTPNFFEGCSTPNQQIIDFMALSYPGPELFLLAVDSETSSSDDVVAQIRRLEEVFGNSIRHHLIVIFNKQELYNSLLYLRDNNIQLEMLDENLASDCKKWGADRQSFLFDYKDYSHRVVQQRRKELKIRRSLGVETETKSKPTKWNYGRYNTIGRASQLTAHNVSQGDLITALKYHPHPARAAGPRWRMPSGLAESDFNIILMGRSGTGKSASANTILQIVDRKKKMSFKSYASSVPVTTTVELQISLAHRSGLILAHSPLQNCCTSVKFLGCLA
ncbi:uncharacterized protein LOC130905531 isoform X2 [Corythoichthys intestinalis]|uniref:uncharacterized protein LOC130905531 isoform X2 n=1 Tax=Corythoichthys intestinalis TaxID=161448 RepID=UPI0025A5B129|nr:uncharacterized protein LOC130905531 isoform X2 [Corythoichthys intestinalis]